MNPVTDDQAWLRHIGVTTTKTDPDPHEETNHTDNKVTDLGVPSDIPPAEQKVHSSLRRFTPWIAVTFGATAVLATIVTAAAGVLTSPDARPPQPPRISTVARPPLPVPPTSATPVSTDAPIPFTASADCPPGSTAAQSLADPQARTPWICVRPVDGQVLMIDLGRTYVITAVSIVPGAVKGGNDDQSDPWLQHRVVSRVQWQFNDTDKTIKTQNTGNAHGEAIMAVPNVPASAITVIIQETSRPPLAAPTTTPMPSGQDNILAPVFGVPLSPDQQAPQLPGQPQSDDPSDGTFAVSSIKIIGHKAI